MKLSSNGLTHTMYTTMKRLEAKGLLKTAIRDDNPVMFLEHKMLYATRGPVPSGEYSINTAIAATTASNGSHVRMRAPA